MTSFNWQINYFYGSFSIALLNYQRVTLWFSFGVTFIFNKFHGNERGDEVQTSRWNLDQIQRIKGYSEIPSGKHTKTDGKSPFLMGKSTISMAIFNCFLYVYQRVHLVQMLFGHLENGPFLDDLPMKTSACPWLCELTPWGYGLSLSDQASQSHLKLIVVRIQPY